MLQEMSRSADFISLSRKNGEREKAQKKNAGENPRRSLLWSSEHSQENGAKKSERDADREGIKAAGGIQSMPPVQLALIRA